MPNDLTELNKFADKWLSGLSWEKKSVRATFKLSQEATEMLTALTESKGESMKEFFDTLCFRLLFWEEALESNDPMLAKLNEHDKKAEIEKLQRQVRKTYVISKTAREKLARFAEKYKLSQTLLLSMRCVLKMSQSLNGQKKNAGRIPGRLK